MTIHKIYKMASLCGISSWGVGIMDGFTSNEGGLPNTVVHGIVGLSGVIAGIASLRYSKPIRGSDLMGSMVAGPVVMATVYGVGNLTGRAARHTTDLYSSDQMTQETNETKDNKTTENE